MLMMMTMLQMCFSRPVFCFRSIIINGEGTGSRETEDEKDENCLGSFVNCLYEKRDERTQKSTGNILEQFLKRTQTTQIHIKTGKKFDNFEYFFSLIFFAIFSPFFKILNFFLFFTIFTAIFFYDFFFNFFLFFLGFFNQFFSEFFSIIFFNDFFWRSWVFYAWLQFLLKNLHWDSLLNECHENAKLRRFLMHARDEPIHHLKCPHLSQFLSQTIPKKGKTYFFSLEKF